MDIIKELPDDVTLWLQMADITPYEDDGLGYVVFDEDKDSATIEEITPGRNLLRVGGKVYCKIFYSDMFDVLNYHVSLANHPYGDEVHRVYQLDIDLVDKSIIADYRKNNPYTIVEVVNKSIEPFFYSFGIIDHFCFWYEDECLYVMTRPFGRYMSSKDLFESIQKECDIKRVFRPDGKEVEF